MHTQIEFIKFCRNSIIKIMDELSIGQMNTVPQGFNNNLIWQLGHLVVTLQNYCYANAGLPLSIEQYLIDQYGNGTKPGAAVTEEEYVTIKNLALSTLEQFSKDLAEKRFENFTPKTLGNGIQINSIDDALEMMVFHEAMHLGECKMLKNAILA